MGKSFIFNARAGYLSVSHADPGDSLRASPAGEENYVIAQGIYKIKHQIFTCSPEASQTVER